MNKTFILAFLFTLLSGYACAEDAVTEVLSKSTVSWDGSKLPGCRRGKPEITVLKITIPPGVQLPMHKHPVINVGILISGELTVISNDNKTLHLKAGEPIVELVDKWHYGKNEGASPAVIIVVYSGITDLPISIKK
jgi:quercetin dioxygenase-like cupin family protein